jgi:hypothetical protein
MRQRLPFASVGVQEGDSTSPPLRRSIPEIVVWVAPDVEQRRCAPVMLLARKMDGSQRRRVQEGVGGAGARNKAM